MSHPCRQHSANETPSAARGAVLLFMSTVVNALARRSPEVLLATILAALGVRAFAIPEWVAWAIVLTGTLPTLTHGLVRLRHGTQLDDVAAPVRDEVVACPVASDGLGTTPPIPDGSEQTTLTRIMRRQIETVITTTDTAAFSILDRLRAIETSVAALLAGFDQMASDAATYTHERQSQARERMQAGAAQMQARLAARVLRTRAHQEANEAQAGHLSEQVTRIGAVARHTKTLAINASIEAGRSANDQPGFKIIAGEVRALADRSALISKEIDQGIGVIVASMDRSIEQMIASSAIEDETTLADLWQIMAEMASSLDELCAKQNAMIATAKATVGDAVVDALASIQFQDITRQQLGGVCHALELLDEHHRAGHDQPVHGDAGPGPSFADRLADLEQRYVSFSQRRDHALGSGSAGAVAMEQAIELF